MPALYVDVIIPLAVKDTFTYLVPAHLEKVVQFGVRVEVPFGKKKLYAALVVCVHDQKPEYPIRRVLSIIDDHPVISELQLRLWKWMSSYYLCDLGEVMYAGMPARLKLQSETRIKPGQKLDDRIFDLNDQEYMIAEAVSIQKEITIDQIRQILEIKTVYPIVKKLLELDVIEVYEELGEDFKPKKVTAIRLAKAFQNPKNQSELFEKTKNSDHQTKVLLAILQQQREKKTITQADVIKMTEVNHGVIAAMEKKGLIERYDETISRLPDFDEGLNDAQALSANQKTILQEIEGFEDNQKPILLHGVTGSGKTRIYIELILKVLARGQQVLYLLPEIALTTQIVQRLRTVLGEHMLVYHSRINENARVEVWKDVLGFPKVVLAARSGIFLPFSDLGLVVVDEEHDPSYKQEEPNPRYQGRDAAIFLAQLHKAMIVLGSATPSMESYYNAVQGKYNLLTMTERFGNLQMPEIAMIDLKKGSKSSHLSPDLIDEIKAMKADGFQTILFQNRRGFAPILMCSECGWTTLCKNCDTSLTYHQYSNQMRCHLCGYHEKPAMVCPLCGNHELTLKGFGTEMIEDEVKILLPELKTARLDLDSARGKNQLEKIIYRFESGEIDVLIGTQMISKGLDFDRVGLVGIISADHLLHFPDFRAAERAFQLMTQVAGRSGRKYRRGRVLIQAYHTSHPVMADVISGDYDRFYRREIKERKDFGFPPFSRMIIITTKHTEASKANMAAETISRYLKQRLGDRVSDAIIPSISRIRNRYLGLVVMKLEKKSGLIQKTKTWISESILLIQKQKGFSTLRVSVNVDP
ncbi:MAG: primosomal protein N' [Saprospiraceae bacterium]|nr:primosomal protein N' [Saprospiraceae bacterium]